MGKAAVLQLRPTGTFLLLFNYARD